MTKCSFCSNRATRCTNTIPGTYYCDVAGCNGNNINGESSNITIEDHPTTNPSPSTPFVYHIPVSGDAYAYMMMHINLTTGESYMSYDKEAHAKDSNYLKNVWETKSPNSLSAILDGMPSNTQ